MTVTLHIPDDLDALFLLSMHDLMFRAHPSDRLGLGSPERYKKARMLYELTRQVQQRPITRARPQAA